MSVKDFNRACNDFTSAISISPNVAPFYAARSQAWYELGNKDRARDDMNKYEALTSPTGSLFKKLAFSTLKLVGGIGAIAFGLSDGNFLDDIIDKFFKKD
ncbi:MAG: hypothetical protein IJU91_07715 [Selenomonadaceae bacterium]|nr:hypothetical protein [Selenomonadaceae bacterium]